LTPNTHSP